MRASPAAIEANRVRARKRMQDRHAQGLCSTCPKKALGKGWRCADCLRKNATYAAEYRSGG